MGTWVCMCEIDGANWSHESTSNAFDIYIFEFAIRVWFARSASPPKWHVHVNIAVVYSNWRWNNKYFLISNRIVIRLYFCECERAQRNKHTKKNSRFHFSFLFFVVSFFMLLISSRSRLFMVRSWEKTEFHTHSPTCYLKPSGIILHPK